MRHGTSQDPDPTDLVGEAPSDDPFFTVVGNAISGSYIPDNAGGGETGGGSGGPGSVVSEQAGGLTINLIFDAAALAAPASFRAGIQQAAAILSATITNNITVNLRIDYSGTGGGAAAGPDSGLFESYSSIRDALINQATPGDTIYDSLPAGPSVQGKTNIAVWNAQLKLFGILDPNDVTTDDGSATFATDINPNLLVGVALHELTHALGRVPYGPQPDIFDMYRFTAPGVRLFQGGATAPAAYFSLDGGVTRLADFGRNSDASDFLNAPGSTLTPNDPFNEFYNGSTAQVLSAVDKQILDALGFHTTLPPATTVIEALGSTSLVQVGTNYFLDSTAGGTGPELKYLGSPITAGQFSGWAPIGAEPTANGYEVAWTLAGQDKYTVWNTDANGNDTTQIVSSVSGTNLILESLETGFQQDLNGDGVIGITGAAGTMIESRGSSELVQTGNVYEILPATGGSGPTLKYLGASITVGQFPGWAPIGAETTASGYEVAWKLTGQDKYTVWNTDTNGNDTTQIVSSVSGTSVALKLLETSFHQDLNGDGVIGIPGLIEAQGSSDLEQANNVYQINPVAGGAAGPTLKYLGADITVGQFPGWAPIGAEATASGYEVAWKLTGQDKYTVWNTDANGNDTTQAVNGVSGTSLAFETLETSFHQDLNGDGVIGIPPSGVSAGAVPSVTVAQAPSVTVVSNDTFHFASDAAGTGGTLGVAGNAALGVSLFTALVQNVNPDVSQAATDGHFEAAGLDPTSDASFHFADLHTATAFIH